jgi:hypothetical protein
MRGKSFIDEFLNKINRKHRGKILQWIRLLETHGPNLPRPYADILDGDIRELRVQFGKNKYRLFYFFSNRNIVMTHAILKKTGAVSAGEIEKARTVRALWLARKN